MKQAVRSAGRIGVLVVAALGLTGCSLTAPAASEEVSTATDGPGPSSPAPAEQESDPEVVDRAPEPSEQLQIVEAKAWPDGMGEWLYVVIVENPSDELAYFADRFDVQAVDADGAIVESTTTYETVPPASRTVVTDTFRNLDGLGAEAITVVTPETGTVVEPGSLGHFEISDVELSTDADGRQALVGTVTSHFAETQTGATITTVFRDPSGQIVHVEGGGVLEDLPPGESVEFSILMSRVPDGAIPEAFGAPIGLHMNAMTLRSVASP